MALDQHASNLIDITATAFNGDVTSISPTDGMSLITSWLDVLHSEEQPNQLLINNLSELNDELRTGNLDSAKIQRILTALTNETKQIAKSADADSKPKLTSLSEALQGLNQLVSGTAKRANTGGQAPMTSTVGASALTANDDELSGRNGGTVDTDYSQSGGRSQ